MIYKIVPILFTLIFISISGSTAQQAMSASGANYKDSGGTISFTVGQIDYQVQNGSDGFAFLGVQQPVELFKSPVWIAQKYIFEVQIFPNPCQESLNIVFSGNQFTDMRYNIYSSDGKCILKHLASAPATTIELSSFSAGIYLVEIDDGTHQKINQKIIKL